MRVSVIQMNPGADKAANIAQAGRLIDDAIEADRPGLVSLPEMWTCLGGDRATKQAASEVLPAPGSNEPGGPAYEFLRRPARERGIHVHGGSPGETTARIGLPRLGRVRWDMPMLEHRRHDVFGPKGLRLA